MTNPTIEFLNELVGKKVLVTSSFLGIKPGSKITLKNFELLAEDFKIIFEYKKKEFVHTLNWKENLPFTHFISAKSAYFHAKRVKKRFVPEIENVVFKNSPKLLYLYAISFIKENFPPELEKIVVKNPYYAFKYAKNYLDKRLSEDQEKIFFKDKSGESLAFYGLEVVKGKLPEELHNFLLLKSMEKNISSFTKTLINNYFKMFSNEDFLPQEGQWIFNKIPKMKKYSMCKNAHNNTISIKKLGSFKKFKK